MDSELYRRDDYKDHPCNRPCEDDGQPRLCQYSWVLETYGTMSKACFGCPFNQSDCFKPHCVPADGVQRGIVTANRLLPGPALEVCEGDTIEVKVHNEMTNSEATSIHWHGLLQKGTPHMDGVSMVTQCPILSRTSFTYRFQALDPGTHYWHGHAGLHRADGLFGAIVVRQSPARDPHSGLYDHDLSEHVIMVHDWQEEMSLAGFIHHHHYNVLTMPRQMLINGLGAYQEFKEGNISVYTPRASFTVEAGKRYRFRVISNPIMVCPLQISVDDHTMLVIASDGQPIEPIETESLNIVNGERYDFVLHANKINASRNFWIRARGFVLCEFNKAYQVAVLRYRGAPEVDPPEPISWSSGFREGTLLNPWNGASSDDEIEVTRMRTVKDDLNDSVLTSVPDKTFYFALGFTHVDSYWFNHPEYYPLSDVDNSRNTRPTQINGISSRQATSPPLTQFDDVPQYLYCNEWTVQQDCSKEWCSCVHKVEVTLGDLVEIVLVDEGLYLDANHPFHLHGFKFRVVAMGKLNTSTTLEEVKALDRQGKINRTRSGAPYKDTVTVPDGGYVVLRFRADNPGIWNFHCHNVGHTINGMSVMIQVGQKSDFPKFPKNFPKCGSWTEPVYEEEGEINDGVYCKNIPGNSGLRTSVGSLYVIVLVMTLVPAYSRWDVL